jgi:hypothetical protein
MCKIGNPARSKHQGVVRPKTGFQKSNDFLPYDGLTKTREIFKQIVNFRKDKREKNVLAGEILG